MKHKPIPEDFPVKPLTEETKLTAKDIVTCGHCGLSWDDSICTTWTPAPSARCPFEYFHIDDEDQKQNPKTYFDIPEIEFDKLRKLLQTYGPRIVIDGISCLLHEMNRKDQIVKDENGIAIDSNDVITAATNLSDLQLY